MLNIIQQMMMPVPIFTGNFDVGKTSDSMLFFFMGSAIGAILGFTQSKIFTQTPLPINIFLFFLCMYCIIKVSLTIFGIVDSKSKIDVGLKLGIISASIFNMWFTYYFASSISNLFDHNILIVISGFMIALILSCIFDFNKINGD